MKFTKIEDHRVHGYEATVGNRRVEVVRCYEGAWACFCYETSEMIPARLPHDKLQNVPESEARKQARHFLRGGVAYLTEETQKNAVLDRLGLRPETEERCPCPECACCCCEFMRIRNLSTQQRLERCLTYEACGRRCACPRVPKKEKKCTSFKETTVSS